MRQTFNDIYKERRAESAGHGFVLRTFAETGVGIFKEHMLLITEGHAMKTQISNPRLAPVISFVLGVLPFMILEWATRSNTPRSDASPMLWIVLWFFSTIFVVILMTIIRILSQTSKTITANPVSLLFRFVFVVCFAWLWGALVIDQMPCFLGGSGC